MPDPRVQMHVCVRGCPLHDPTPHPSPAEQPAQRLHNAREGRRTGTAGDRLGEHVVRTGVADAILTDPAGYLQYQLLRRFVDVAETAMSDAGLPYPAAQRALDLIIERCVPSHAEIAQRGLLAKELAEKLQIGELG